MAIKQSALILGAIAAAYPHFAGELIAQKASFSVAATGANAVAADDIIEMMEIPPGLVPVGMTLVGDDLDSDSTPAITADVGIMSGTPGDTDVGRTIGAEFFSGTTVFQAGGVANPTLKTAYRVASSTTPRSIGIKIATAADVLQAGVVDLIVLFAAA